MTAGLHHGTQVLAQFFKRRTPDEPPAVVDFVDRQVGSQGKGVRNGQQTVFGIRRCDLNNVELPNGFALMVAEKCKGSTHASPEGGTDLWRVSADHSEITVVHPQLILQVGEVPNLARAFWSPVSAIEAEDKRKALGELGEFDVLVAMIGEFQVWQAFANDEIWVHRGLLDSNVGGPLT